MAETRHSVLDGSPVRRLQGLKTPSGSATEQGEFLFGESPALRDLSRKAGFAAASGSNLLLVGETGTGKGLLARWIHRISPRCRAPFVHFDCAATPPTLFETELFGHERGAFTGAQARRLGRVEKAKNGTLFLDEMGELGSGEQAKFLRLLEDRVFERVGGSRSIPFEARVLAATNRSLSDSAAFGWFRQDLLHRLSVITLRIPPLRERPEDIPALVDQASARIAIRVGRRVRVDASGLRVLRHHPWPGNVRQVMNLIERAAICWPDQVIDAPLADRLLDPSDLDPSPLHALPDLAAGRRTSAAHLSWVIEACEGNVSRAARLLGIPRSTLRYRLHAQREEWRPSKTDDPPR